MSEIRKVSLSPSGSSHVSGAAQHASNQGGAAQHTSSFTGGAAQHASEHFDPGVQRRRCSTIEQGKQTIDKVAEESRAVFPKNATGSTASDMAL